MSMLVRPSVGCSNVTDGQKNPKSSFTFFNGFVFIFFSGLIDDTLLKANHKMHL